MPLFFIILRACIRVFQLYLLGSIIILDYIKHLVYPTTGNIFHPVSWTVVIKNRSTLAVQHSRIET